jgi:drug/metabolite transporter (DMT)-like permease
MAGEDACRRINLKTIQTGKWLPYLELGGSVTIWGASFVATKIALQEASPIMVVWLRFSLGLGVMGVAMWLRHPLTLPSKTMMPYLALVGFIGITFHQWLQSTALQTTWASTSSWIVATAPIFMALLGWVFLRERMDWIAAAGIVLASLGLALVVSRGEWAELFGGRFGGRGDLLMLISAVNWAVFSTISKPGLKRLPPTQMMFWVIAWGWVFTSIWLWMQGGWRPIPSLSTAGWISLLFLGIFCSGVAYLFWYDGLEAVPVVQVGAFLYFEPLVTLIIAAFLLGESINWASLLGGMLILGGVGLVNRALPPEGEGTNFPEQVEKTEIPMRK